MNKQRYWLSLLVNVILYRGIGTGVKRAFPWDLYMCVGLLIVHYEVSTTAERVCILQALELEKQLYEGIRHSRSLQVLLPILFV